MAEREFTAAAFAQYLQEGKLMGSRCRRCGRLHMPPHPLCLSCHSPEMEWTEVPPRGRLAAFTTVAVGTTPMLQEGYDRNRPYCSGVVELEGGVRVSARIIGVEADKPETIQVGMPLVAEFLVRGEGETKRTVLAFKPA